MLTALRASQGLFTTGLVADAVLLIEDDKVYRCGPANSIEIPAQAKTINLGDALLAPAFLDIHIHGSAGHDVMYASSEGQRNMTHFLARHGTGRFLATTVTASVDSTLAALSRIADWIERRSTETFPGACPIGIHLEGPFISHAKRGVQPAEYIQPPDIALFDRFFDAARGHIRLMTLAPEQPGAIVLLRHARSRGVRISLGHSDATALQARAGVEAGADSATHCFNAMRGFDHREPGMTGVALDAIALYAEIICDGHHVSPEAVRLFAKAKRPDRRLLITDAISAAGQGDGSFALGDLQVTVTGDRADLDGKLAGSVLTLDSGVARFLAQTGLPLAEAARAAAVNPAEMLGLDRGLEVGSKADIVALSPEGRVQAVMLAGEFVQ